MKLLVAGDMHIPHRASEIPRGFREVFEEISPDIIILTGDYTEKRVYEEFSKRGKTYAVRGNMDRFRDLPLEASLEVEGIRIGVIHGHQIFPRGDRNKLLRYAESKDLKILFHGHTHLFDVYEASGRLLINPGTLTAARGGIALEPEHSFAEISIGEKIEVKKRLLEDKREVVAMRRFRL